jgi:hypothetical protein
MSPSFARYAGFTAVAAALLLAVTAIWFALYSSGITVPPVPDAGSLEQQAEDYYRQWFPSVAAQDLAIRLLGAAAFAILALAGALTARSSGDSSRRFVAGAALAGAGLLGAAAFLAQYGGFGAVADAATSGTPVQTIGMAAYVIDQVAGALLIGAYALAGLGILAAGGEVGVERVVGVLAGGGALLLAVTGLMDDPLGYGDALRLAVAVVLLPAWAATQVRSTPARGTLARPATGRALDAG